MFYSDANIFGLFRFLAEKLVNFSDIDECAEKNNTCDPGTTICKNTIGSYECSCNKKGFAKIPGKRDRCEGTRMKFRFPYWLVNFNILIAVCGE